MVTCSIEQLSPPVMSFLHSSQRATVFSQSHAGSNERDALSRPAT